MVCQLALDLDMWNTSNVTPCCKNWCIYYGERSRSCYLLIDNWQECKLCFSYEKHI